MEELKMIKKDIMKFLYKSILLVLISVGPIILFNYMVDPLQFYRKSTKFKPIFSDEQRLQNPGLAKNYDYDAIILGTSMTENFLPSSVDSKLGVKSLKLSMEGSSVKEQKLIFDVANSTGKPKTVIWELNYFSFYDKSDINKGNEGYEFPMYFYDKNKINDIRYLISNDILKHSMTVIAYNLGILTPAENTDLEYLNNWQSKYAFSEERVLEDFKRITTNLYVTDTDNWDLLKKNIDNYLLKSIEENPCINFILYYPPFTDLMPKYLYMRNENDFNNFLKIREYVFSKIQDLQNVQIYDFQASDEITGNYDYYKDLSHHSQEVNEWILDMIRENKYMVTEDNIGEFLYNIKEDAR